MSWSDKYKRSIDCNNPRGFSQRAHCQGLKKKEDEAKHSEAMPKLSQHGSWDPALEQRARSAMEFRFAEDSDAFDYALCQRPDSSFYGIADGKRCIKGRGPIARNDALRTLAKKGVPREILGKVARIKDEKKFDKTVEALSTGRKKQAGGPAVKPLTKTPTLEAQKAPKGGVDAAAKRKGETMPAGRDEKRAKIAERRAELKKKLKEKEPEKKPVEDRKAAMEAAPKKAKERVASLPPGQKTSTQNLIEQLFPGQNGTPDPGDIKAKQKVYAELEKRWGAEKAERMIRTVAPLLGTAAPSQRALSSTLRPEEVQAMQNKDIQKKLREGYDDPSKLIGGRFEYNKQTKRLDFVPNDGNGQIIEMKLKDIDDDMAWAYYKLAPASFRKTIDGSGKPKEKAFMGYDEDGNPVHGSKSANDARRLHLTKLWMAQGGRDAYTGLPLTFANADLEHIVPMEKLGKRAESPNNWVWVSNSANQTKRGMAMNEFLDGKGPAKQVDRFNGVNNITDLARWGQYAARQSEAAVSKKAAGASLKTGASEVLAKLKADNDTRESTIAMYRGETAAKNKLDKVLKYIADLDPAVSSQQGFRRETPYKNEKGEPMRNNAKGIMLGQANFDVGQVKGKMTMAEWSVREWPNLTGSQRARAASIWEEVVQDWSENGKRNGWANNWMAQEFARRATEILE